jgi:hypothetical protein
MAGTPAQNGNSAAGNSDFSRKAKELAREMWTAPQAHDVTMRGSGQVPNSKAGNACLARDATNWPTPSAAQDTKGAQATAEAAIEREGRGKQLSLSDRSLIFSLPAPQTAPHGNLSRHQRRIAFRLIQDVILSAPRSVSRPWCPPMRPKPSNSARETWRRQASWTRWSQKRARFWTTPRLSPLFVEWLMGWPAGHALCDCSAMEFAHWRQDMRGALSALPTASGPWIWEPPAETLPPTQLSLL